ncbi:hypothetical protein K466DRAFT_17558 [Polyporus arcularius HHB13444]|uniref:Uncharacterized protein n=1 Tax=Polyporus arcularius HHB13444 TaxID=1314778 RepID=A0A5C3NQW2_9APHY|nr:hypothetical protein K466DRAFT_17558 [Polyporus arcularius HHB13444]
MLAASPHAARSTSLARLKCTSACNCCALARTLPPPARLPALLGASSNSQSVLCHFHPSVRPRMHTRPAFLPSLAATLRYRAQCIAADHEHVADVNSDAHHDIGSSRRRARPSASTELYIVVTPKCLT